MGQITTTRNLVATKVVRHAGQRQHVLGIDFCPVNSSSPPHPPPPPPTPPPTHPWIKLPTFSRRYFQVRFCE